MNNIDINAFLQGIADSEGSVDKANKIIVFTNKDPYVIAIIEKALQKIGINFEKRIDKRQRTNLQINDLEGFNKKIGFNTIRKQKALEELIAGNFVREKDKKYLERIQEELKKGS